MKKINLKVGTAALIVFGFLLSSCAKDDDNGNSMQTFNSVNTNLQTGNWKITLMIDSGVDETSEFAGYNFTFNQNGVLNANNGTTNYNGVWALKDDDGDYDGLEDLELTIFFNVLNDFEDLNDEWDFISNSANKIELIDVSGGNEPDDYLTFERI